MLGTLLNRGQWLVLTLSDTHDVRSLEGESEERRCGEAPRPLVSEVVVLLAEGLGVECRKEELLN